MATSLTRRGFTQALGFGAASAVLRPLLPSADALPLVAKPATGAAAHDAASAIVRISSNENPYGPSPAAFAAMRRAFDVSWRYPDEAADELAGDLAKLHGVSRDHIQIVIPGH